MAKKYKKRIIGLKRYGKSGWTWQIKNTKYRTNGIGDGLWGYSKSGSMIRTTKSTKHPSGWKSHKEWKQVYGTAQFDLPKDRKKAYNKIYYNFIK